MPLPTLALRGNLRPYNDDPAEKARLDAFVPVEYVIDWFRQRLNRTGIDARVLVLKSETASGKSTMFPPELYKAMVHARGSKRGIICTQPRTLTAIENVNEMLKHYSAILRLGDTIGWSTKYNKLRPKTAALLSATVGTLAQQLKSMTDDELMNHYQFILIDETHERDESTDLVIAGLKGLLKRQSNNPNCPFVAFMSATFDPDPLLEYFGVDHSNFIWCTGETAGFDEIWDWNEGRTVNNYTQAAATVVERILREHPDDPPEKADILIFLPGAAEFTQAAEWLDKLNAGEAKAGRNVFSLLKVDGPSVTRRTRDYIWTMYTPVSEHEVEIGGKVYTPARRVILTTNVAETGLTLDNLKYVIDGGYNREIEYNPVLGVRGLMTKPAPVSRIRQRRGRAGRKFRGVFYPLYPKWIYDMLPVQQFPAILVGDVINILPDIMRQQLRISSAAARGPVAEFDPTAVDMVDVPSADALWDAISRLHNIGMITTRPPPDTTSPAEFGAVKALEYKKLAVPNTHTDKNLFGFSRLGLFASCLSIPPEHCRMLLAAYSWRAPVVDVVSMTAYLLKDTAGFAESQDPTSKVMPKVDWRVVYKSVFGGRANPVALMEAVADDMINGAVLVSAIMKIIEDTESSGVITALRKWCRSANISYRWCLDLIRVRDEILEQMITACIRIVDNIPTLLRCPADRIIDVITTMKHCIYDGWRNNLLVWSGVDYRTRTGHAVITPARWQDAKDVPRFLLYNQLSMKENRTTSVYAIVSDRTSMLDGFVAPDLAFDI